MEVGENHQPHSVELAETRIFRELSAPTIRVVPFILSFLSSSNTCTLCPNSIAAPVENFVRVVHFTRTSSPQGCTTFNCQVDGKICKRTET